MFFKLYLITKNCFMKKIVLFVLCFVSSFTFLNAQETDTKTNYRAAFGAGGIQNLGTRKPFTSINEWSIGLSAAFEYHFSENWSIEQAINVNTFQENDKIDGGVLTKKFTYLGTNTNFKWYPNLLKLNSFKLFANAGIGVFKIEDLNTSANLGCGALFWFSDNFGIRTTALSKIAIDSKYRVFDNNHFQYMLELVYGF